MKRFALLMVVLTLLAPPAWVLAASFEDANGPKDKKRRPKVRTIRQRSRTTNQSPVPEPATITLLGSGGWCGCRPQALAEPTALAAAARAGSHVTSIDASNSVRRVTLVDQRPRTRRRALSR